jgi:cardiolipin synthase
MSPFSARARRADEAMHLPKARNLLIGIAVGLMVIAGALLIAQDQETLRVRTPVAASDAAFPEYLARLLGAPLTVGDSYIVHTDGPAAFAAMLDAINTAKHRVSFETYVYNQGIVADHFTAAFEAAARRGVSVRLVLDSIGAQDIQSDHIDRLRAAGCQVAWFNEVTSRGVIEETNYRTHRKSLVADGARAFVGGIGISDYWNHDTERGRMWRDTMVEVRGPAAVYIEGSFNENWIESGEVVEPDLLPHDDTPAGSARSIVVWSGPEGGASGMKLLYLLSIASARRTLDIETPYLILDESTEWSLTEGARRGVKIRLLLESEITDAKPVKFAGRAAYERLLERGIEIYEYQPAMMHAKVIVVDDVLSVVGSANLDNRSLELNDELNVAVFDKTLANRLLEDFERDLRKSTRIDLEAWRSRPLHISARDKLWSLFGEVF